MSQSIAINSTPTPAAGLGAVLGKLLLRKSNVDKKEIKKVKYMNL